MVEMQGSLLCPLYFYSRAKIQTIITHIAFPQQQWSRGCASVLGYMYITYLVRLYLHHVMLVVMKRKQEVQLGKHNRISSDNLNG